MRKLGLGMDLQHYSDQTLVQYRQGSKLQMISTTSQRMYAKEGYCRVYMREISQGLERCNEPGKGLLTIRS